MAFGDVRVEDSGSQLDANRQVAAQQERHENSEPQRIVERLMQTLPRGTKTIGSFRDGGTVKKTGPYKLHAGEQVMPADENTQAAPTDTQSVLAAKSAVSAPQQQDASQQENSQTALSPVDQEADDSTTTEQDTEAVKSVNLQKDYSRLNEALTTLADEAGVKRNFTIPYVDGGSMADHITAVGTVAMKHGGVTQNLMTTHHHAGGKGWGSGDGSTQGYPTEKLRQTTIQKDDPHAAAAIAAANKLIRDVEFLVGPDDKTVQQAKGQMALFAKDQAAQMTIFDLMVALINIVHPPVQTVARKVSTARHGMPVAHRTAHRQ